MIKYEIMMILAPATDEKVAKDLLESTFKSGGIEKFEVMDRTELAYEINKSKTAKYVLAIVNSNNATEELSEFTRKVNINKVIWRKMVVNLTTERGLGKENVPMKIVERKPRFDKPRNQRPNNYRKSDTTSKE
ncbi:small subunit ribosomal protein S6 [Mycoplasma testudineum]|uniref:Small ribosomal subunit protein bS6 n=1 Tax=Mycoplasma testudineum TaxID=244584 RepID=A0A4V6PSD0_9MOLU|nr:30S ribosomal protein S6 [Mycoplasma testudineum]OYD27118.1 30S ribosomal protein S6 [Mycoplasma testudineum]TDO21129.1 small subunit ribosomal protein S6 [Mycoplasma testudineum]